MPVEEARSQVMQQNAFLQAVLDGTPEPIMVIGLDYRILMANRAARDLTPVMNRASRCYEICHHRLTPCNDQGISCPMQLVLEGRETVNVMHTHFNAAGEPRQIELLASPLRDPDGEIVGIITNAHDITALKEAEAQIRQLAYYDTLTGLPNRRLLLDRLNHALTQARRFGRSMAVMFLDLDHFKQINDAFGHSAGDELLIQAAQRLAACVRAGDTVARPGGDEFIIVLTEVSHPLDAARVAEKIIDAFATPVPVDDQRIPVTISIGIALYPVNGSDDVEELMIKADMAMYEAKEAGRNAYRFFPTIP
jgi:diguanylate cyclase (GGDEF)-like protein